MKLSKKAITVGIIILCAMVILGIKYYQANFLYNTSAAVDARVKGSPDAPLKVTEFIDFQCPACAHGAKYLKDFMEKNPGVVRLEMKYFPLKMHTHAMTSAQYAECSARQGKFWEVHDELIARQDKWKVLISAEPVFRIITEQAGVDQQKLKACLEGGQADEVIAKHKEEGHSLGVRSTPTYFVNGKILVGSNNLQKEIDNYLNARQSQQN